MSGLRETNKRDKLKRIKLAAKKIFSAKGFDAATTKEISEVARVGAGTLFQYAVDKRDLVFLIASDDFSVLMEQTFLGRNKRQTFMSQIVEVFKVYYVYYAANREISMVLLRELPFYKRRESAGAAEMTRHYEAVVEHLIAIIKDARAQGKINTKAQPQVVADVLFSIFGREVRRWLSQTNPRVADGIKLLRQRLCVVIDGLSPGRGCY